MVQEIIPYTYGTYRTGMVCTIRVWYEIRVWYTAVTLIFGHITNIRMQIMDERAQFSKRPIISSH